MRPPILFPLGGWSHLTSSCNLSSSLPDSLPRAALVWATPGKIPFSPHFGGILRGNRGLFR